MARSLIATSSQSIIVPSAVPVNLGTGDFTVMAWVRFPVAPPDASMIVGKRAGGFDGDDGWELKFNSGTNETVRWDVDPSGGGRQRAEATLTGITNGNWHLVGGDHTEGIPAQLLLWFDGAIAATKAASTPGTVDTITPMVIGAAYNTPNTNYITGEIGSVFLFKRLLTLAEHQALAAGFSPRFLNPSPEFLLELSSRSSPEPDIAGGLFGTLENAPTVVPGPRLTYPRSADIGQDLWFEYCSATIDGQSDLAATITRGRTADATIDGQSFLSVVSDVDVPISATIPAQSTVSADLSADAAASCVVYGQSSLTASINIDALERAICRARSTVTASLSADVPVATAVAAQSATAADLSADVPVSASSAGQSTLTVTGDRIRTISAVSAGQSATAAAVTITASASVLLEGQSGASAFLSATVPVIATAPSSADIVADTTSTVPVSATSTALSAISGTITRGRAGAGAIPAQSNLSVFASSEVPLSAVADGLTALSAALSADVPLAATSAATSELTARLVTPGAKRTITTGGSARWVKTVGGTVDL